MPDLPSVNSLIHIAIDQERNYRSRVEDLDGAVLTVGAPIGKGDVHVPNDGDELTVFWTGPRTRYMLRVEMLGLTREAPPRWHLLALEEPRRQNRRRHVRAGLGGRVDAQPIPAEGAAEPPYEPLGGEIVDISEAAVRVRVGKTAAQAGDPAELSVRLGGHVIRTRGDIYLVEQAARGQEVVFAYDLPETDAQVIRKYVFEWELAERRRQRDERD